MIKDVASHVLDESPSQALSEALVKAHICGEAPANVARQRK